MTPMSGPHRAFESLPIVDVSGLGSPSLEDRQAVAVELGVAAREVGFLYVTGHGVSPALVEGLLKCTQAYFAQPLAAKMQNYIGKSLNHSGYVPEGEEQFASGTKDLKEAYDIGFEVPRQADSKPMLGPNQWPDFPGFRETVGAYYGAVYALSTRLFRGFALALGLPEHRFEALVTTPPSQLRLIHYPFDAENPRGRPGIGAHTDYECFTILLPTQPGLEVKNGAGSWVDVPVIDGTYVINIGDMLEVLSNGQFVATSHRVRRVAQERFAFPLFCCCDYDTVIEPLSELCTAGRNTQYQPMVCGDHLYAQTIQTFSYLKARLARGEISLPPGTKPLSSFGYSALED